MSYRIFTVGQAIKTLSSPQFSSFTAGRGTISILGETGATGICGITNPFSIAGSPTEATFATEPDRVPFAVRPWSIAGGARADAAGALGRVPALLGTPAPGMPRDAARLGGRDIGACARRGCWVANRSGSPAERFLWRVNHGPRHRHRRNRARGLTGSQCFGLGALRHLGAGQRGRPGFDRGCLQTAAGPLIET